MANGKNIKHGKLEVTIGNLKLGNNTLIFNMGSATDCSSRKLGLCKLGNKCYALKAEKVYPQCKPYRDRQADYWITHTPDEIIKDLHGLLTTKKTRVDGKLTPYRDVIKYFRFNEAGDFYNQADVRKLDKVAQYLKIFFNIDTYGYTARKDLNYRDIEHFSLKGSGWLGPNGMTVARKIPNTKDKPILAKKATVDNLGVFNICPMDCRDCTLCKTGNENVVFPLH